MLQPHTLIAIAWDDYELLDSGEGLKLERFGSTILERPDTQALWAQSRPDIWNTAHTRFVYTDGKGAWETVVSKPHEWNIQWNKAQFHIEKTNFKHVGLFPEQSANWSWIQERIQTLPLKSSLPDAQGLTSASARVLNLFGYTGAATVAAALAGAAVVHVDASKQSLDWAHDNARLSGVAEDRVRYIPDDALVFARREVRRGNVYDGIILDPPAFGRGLKGEVWKIEDNIVELLQLTKQLLSNAPGSFLLLNGYAAGFSPITFKQIVESVFTDISGEYGELVIAESDSTRTLPTGIYVRFVR